MKSIQTFLEEFNYIPFGEKPKILLEAWGKFFTIQRAQPEDSNKLFQKHLEDLKELEEYKESLENSSKEIDVSNSNQEKEEPPQDSNIRQLIREECGIKVCEEKKQNMEDTMLELEVKNVVKQPGERRTRIVESLQNFKVIHKSSISLNNTSQISSVQAIAPILSTKEPEYSPSMGYEHLSTTPETELDEVTEFSANNLLPIPSECEVTSEDESKYDMPIQYQSSSVFMTFSNPLFKDNDDLTSSDDESLSEEDVPIKESKVYSNPLFNDDEINSDELESHVESNFVESLSNHDVLIDSSQKIDYLEEFFGKLAHIDPVLPGITESDFDFEEEIRLTENLLYDNSSPRPPKELNAEIVDTIIESLPSLPIPVQDGDSQREEIDIVTETDDVLPSSKDYAQNVKNQSKTGQY
nr:hypothetical protein [Tanacetum cinerariifolium]